MRVLITGGTGFVGSFTAAELARRGHRVVCFDRQLRPPAWLVEGWPDIVRIEGDILDRESLLGVMRDHQIEAVVHAAAVIGQGDGAADPDRMYQINVGGTLSVLEAVRAVGARMAYVSTATLYGQHPDLHTLSEDARPEPVGMYDTTKLMAETLAITYHKVYGLDIVAVRPGYVYGPGNSTGGYFLDQVFAGQSIEHGPGADLPMDVTYVKDLALGLYLALTVRPISQRIFNITGGVLRRRSEVAEIACRLVPGARIQLDPGIPPTAHLRGPSDLTRAGMELGYAPQYSLEAGMADWLTYLQGAAQGDEGRAKADQN
jgi:nucleoside-diphosphate-sugar epimerase